MRKSNLCFGATYYWTVKFWVLFYLQQDFFLRIITELLFGCVTLRVKFGSIW